MNIPHNTENNYWTYDFSTSNPASSQEGFSNGSINFSTQNTYLSIPQSSDWAMGTGDFTWEWFQFQTTSNLSGMIYS